ncbi:hypothetical protein FB451DRAFT_1352670 [Mycena latifolia]|nr:hypothetical protein FB451DRAFT_1352670 [Mycena latifolia]
MGANQHKPNPPLEEIAPHIQHYWKMRKNDKEIVRLLNAHHIDSSKYGLGNIVTDYFSIYELELVKERRKNRLRRKRFWAAGVNDLWAVDQHDKWKYKFGLALHSGIDPFIGRIHWMKIWWTNSNPRLILSYYVDAVEELGLTPLVSQSDPGLQHRWMREKKNVMPEIGWSQLRHRFTPGFEDILDVGVNNGWYDPHNLVEALVFRWVFIPWLQKELDSYCDRVNNTAKRADRNKILPYGVPNHMFEHPGDYGVLDFKIQVQSGAIKEVRDLYAPQDHEVFQLVPPDFNEIIVGMYAEIGKPPVTRESCWDIYLQLLNDFHVEQSDQLNRMIDEDEPRGQDDMDEDVELFAWFSDEEFAGGSDIDEW